MKISAEELTRLGELVYLRLPAGAAFDQLRQQLGEIVGYISSIRDYSGPHQAAAEAAPLRRRQDTADPEACTPLTGPVAVPALFNAVPHGE